MRMIFPGRPRALLGALALALLACGSPALAGDPAPIRAAVADFDNLDTSGESGERAEAHAARIQGFAGLLRESLAEADKFEIVGLDCPASPCSMRRVHQKKLLQAAQDAGARLLVYGGIQKMSTLVQFGFVEAVDLKTNKAVFKQAISFRGDTDEAFRRAATFVTDYLKDVQFEQ